MINIIQSVNQCKISELLVVLCIYIDQDGWSYISRLRFLHNRDRSTIIDPLRPAHLLEPKMATQRCPLHKADHMARTNNGPNDTYDRLGVHREESVKVDLAPRLPSVGR